VYVVVVANQFSRYFVGLQHRACQTRGSVGQWRHAIEEMRRVMSACRDRSQRCFVIGA
jgi:hypothetical protein